MPDRLDETPILEQERDISRGQNSRVHASQVPRGQAVELTNVDISEPGKRTIRTGITEKGTGSGTDPIQDLAHFAPSGGTKKLLRVTDNNLEYWTGTGAWTSEGALFSSTPTMITHAMAKGEMFFFGGDRNCRSYDGADITDEGNINTDVPRGKCGLWFQNRLFVLGHSDDLVYFSNSLAPDTFDRATNVFKVNTNDGQQGMALVGWREAETPAIIIFKEASVWILHVSGATPLSDWELKPIDLNVGLKATKAVIHVGKDVLFLDHDGIRSVVRTQLDKAQGGGIPLSFPIQDVIDRINQTYISKSCAFFWKDRCYFGVPLDSATVPSHTLIYHLRTRGWAIYEGWSPACFEKSDVENEMKFYMGDAGATTKVYEVEEGTSDDGTAISYTETSGQYDFGQELNDKTGLFLELDAIATDDYDLDVDVKLDDNDWSDLDTFNLSSDAPTLPQTLPFNLVGDQKIRKKIPLTHLGRFRKIQFKFALDTLDAEYKGLGYKLIAFLENLLLED